METLKVAPHWSLKVFKGKKRGQKRLLEKEEEGKREKEGEEGAEREKEGKKKRKKKRGAEEAVLP